MFFNQSSSAVLGEWVADDVLHHCCLVAAAADVVVVLLLLDRVPVVMVAFCVKTSVTANVRDVSKCSRCESQALELGNKSFRDYKAGLRNRI